MTSKCPTPSPQTRCIALFAYPYRIPATSFAFSPADGTTRALTDFQITQARIVSQKRGVTTYDIDAIAGNELSVCKTFTR